MNTVTNRQANAMNQMFAQTTTFGAMSMSAPGLPFGTRSRTRTTFVGLIAVAVMFALAGCISTSSATTGSAATASAGTTTVSDPNAGLKNGTQLKPALLTTKDVGSGFTVNKDLVRDSGDVFGPKTKTVSPTKAACKDVETNVWIDGAGIGSASFAQTGFKDSYGSEIDAEIDGFRGTSAEAVMANLKKLFTVCSSYKITVPGVPKGTVHLVAKPGSKVGDESVRAVLTSKVYEGGTTLVAIRVGKTVVSVLYSSSSSDLGAKGQKLAETMAKRLAG
jgi:hypothetical protein